VLPLLLLFMVPLFPCFCGAALAPLPGVVLFDLVVQCWECQAGLSMSWGDAGNRLASLLPELALIVLLSAAASANGAKHCRSFGSPGSLLPTKPPSEVCYWLPVMGNLKAHGLSEVSTLRSHCCTDADCCAWRLRLLALSSHGTLGPFALCLSTVRKLQLIPRAPLVVLRAIYGL
jgi:hypothetical protein